MRDNQMNTMIRKQLLGALALGALLHATAADIRDGDNQFSLNGAFGFNIKASFRNLEPPPPDPGPATGTQVDRFYDNGYVRVDASGNAGGQTTYWGFDKAKGATSDGLPGGAVTLTSTRSPAQGQSFGGTDDPQMGVDFGYARRLIRCGDERNPWMIIGVEAGFSWLDLALRNKGEVTGDATTADTFHLAPGNAVLGNSFEGTALGPGPLLDATPTRSLTAGTANVQNALEGQIWGLKAGPAFEIMLGDRASLTFSGGLAVVGVDADYTYSETVAIGSAPPVTAAGAAGLRQWNVGGYVKGELAVLLAEGWRAQAGLQYVNAGQFQTGAGHYSAELDLRESVLFTLGLAFAF
jgi:hypothetical protein